MDTLNFGLIGSGFMGKTHVFGISLADRVFDLPCRLELLKIADASEEMAYRAAKELGVSSYASDWRELIEDDNLDVINITTPNSCHTEMAAAAIKAGKHVYCEKPLAVSADDAYFLADLARKASIKTQVGFNYLCNPMIIKAREMVLDGQLGEIRGFRGIHAEDYMADANSPYTWRHDLLGGGALVDLGSHIIATAEFLLGPITDVMGYCSTSIKRRLDETGSSKLVEVDDVSRAFLKFKNGATGSLEANWLATGRKMQHEFEVFGTEGALHFSQERLNEISFYKVGDPVGQRGFKTIFAGPEHEPYERFCVAPGHQLGFADLKAIEVKGFVEAITGVGDEPFNFSAGARIQALVELIIRSSKDKNWKAVDF
ncbi:MAG: Gfo/Idh/MocA family oxidoreductase [Pseudomonadota bacterium]|nr:Gfo/Idh/MocA family oxidoreductase [Pseudomonadota bacterium]